jgi:hypothetical protein
MSFRVWSSSCLRSQMPVLALIVSLLMSGAAVAITVRVGLPADPACGAFSIPGALAQLPAGSGTHRILLSSNQSYTSTTAVENRNVSIEGGYANCSAAAPAAGAMTRIGPNAAANVALLTARGSAAGVFTVALRDLEIRGPAPVGAVAAEGSVDLIVEDSIIADAGSLSLDGGGIRSDIDAFVFLRGVTEISKNLGNFGGGVSCVDGQLSIESSDVLITGNRANTAGGGVSLVRCNMFWDPDTASTQGGILGNRATIGGGLFMSDALLGALGSGGNRFASRRIIANTADFNGGGIAVQNTSLVSLPQLDASSNRAGVAGVPSGQGNCGGVAVFDSTVSLESFRIEGNTAQGFGGGVCLFTRGEFRVVEPRSCIDGACRSVSFNRAGTVLASDAGAFWMSEDAELSLFATRVIGNTSALSSVIYSEDNTPPNSRIEIVNSLIANNIATTAFMITYTGTTLSMDWTTVADNPSGSTLFEGFGSNSLDLATSILVAAPGTTVLSAPPSNALSTRCLLAHENASLAARGGNAFVGIPGFIDAANGNYRLDGGSLAVDHCAAIAGQEPSVDISGNPRLADLPLSNIFGPGDLGAYEIPVGDAVFASGFE